MAETTQSLYMSFSRKRKALEENLISYEMTASERMKRQCEEEVNFETEFCQAAAMAIILACKKTRKDRGPNEARSETWWEQGYLQWNDAAFKRRLRVS